MMSNTARFAYVAFAAIAALAAFAWRDLLAMRQDAQRHAHVAVAIDSASMAQLAVQIRELRAAVARYSDIDAARKDGYVMFGREERPLMGEHWYREDLVHRPLDLTQPSTLQYATINGKRILVGVAFTVYQKPDEPVPEGFAGSEDHWHVHDIGRMQSAIAGNRPLFALLTRRRAERKNPAIAAGRTNLVMVHVWTGPANPDGMFAEKHRALPYLRAGLPASFSEGATENAAWGIALLQRGACDAELRAVNALAQLARLQRQRLSGACAVAGGKVLAAFRGRESAAALNAAADAAWSAFLAERNKVLTSEQKARLASVGGAPMGIN